MTTDSLSKAGVSKSGAGAAGAGGGTLLVAIATTLPEDSSLRIWLMLGAPTVAIALSAIWLWCQAEVANYFQERKIVWLVRRLRANINAALNDPGTTKKHHEALRKKLELLDLILADRHLNHIQAMVPTTMEKLRELQSPLAPTEQSA